MTRRDKINTFITTGIIVYAVSYFMVDRISLRAAQLANNTMAAEYSPRSILYASIITLSYALLFWLFMADIFGKNGEESS